MHRHGHRHGYSTWCRPQGQVVEYVGIGRDIGMAMFFLVAQAFPKSTVFIFFWTFFLDGFFVGMKNTDM